MTTKDYSKENKESFFARLNGFLTPNELLKIETAYMLAKHAHRAQVRKELGPTGDPLRYFEHVRRVALTYIDSVITVPNVFSRGFSEDICAALLHDTIEDTKDISGEMIEMIFGPDVARTVLFLTRMQGQSAEDYLAKVCSNPRTGFIKLCDKLDNVRSLRAGEVGEEFRVKQKIEVREKYLPVLNNLLSDNFIAHPLLGELTVLTRKS
jgi:(p)ppGpp synthase/HD superfamily hydrolase